MSTEACVHIAAFLFDSGSCMLCCITRSQGCYSVPFVSGRSSWGNPCISLRSLLRASYVMVVGKAGDRRASIQEVTTTSVRLLQLKYKYLLGVGEDIPGLVSFARCCRSVFLRGMHYEALFFIV